MKSVASNLAKLKPNVEWASLPLFDRTGWKRVRFGNVVENCAETCDPAEAGLDRFIAMEHLEPGSLHIRCWGNVADGTTFTRRCRPGQVLFGKRRAYQRKVAVAEFEAVVSGDIYVLTPKNELLLPDLLPFLCLSERFFQHAVGTSAGSLSPRTNWSSLASFEFDLPLLDQQRRIAEILWAADESQRKTRDVIQNAWSVATSECAVVFSDENRPDWVLKPMSEICSIQQGQVDPRTEPYAQMIHIAPDDIASNIGQILECKTAAQDGVISGKYLFTEEAVLYSKIRPNLRKVAFPGFSGICSADVYPVYAKTGVMPQFLFYLLLSDHFTKFAVMHSARSAFPKLNRESLFSFQYRLPPLDVQLDFIRKMQALSDSRIALEKNLAHLHGIQSGILTAISS